MFKPFKIIDEINKTCKNFFPESFFKLEQKADNRFIIFGNNLSKAINNYNNIQEEVNVIKWFNDFWVYIDIRFEKSEPIPNTFISLSVFQGDYSDDKKIQLFRAEWDNFDNNETHPQPHWHIYPNYSFEKTFDEFLEMTDEGGSFAADLNKEKSKIIDLKRIHFAMNGTWNAKGTHIHRITDENAVINWFQGLLDHIKSQLEYVS